MNKTFSKQLKSRFRRNFTYDVSYGNCAEKQSGQAKCGSYATITAMEWVSQYRCI